MERGKRRIGLAIRGVDDIETDVNRRRQEEIRVHNTLYVRRRGARDEEEEEEVSPADVAVGPGVCENGF